ncbi:MULTISPECIES: DinB family protein [Streptomyces]|uniref:DinB family protein n=1 Tax=Streptomyces TaxID=1883 RepID=UPI00211D560F|nr:DinB family protein [Streptomyces sp. f51]
MLSIRISAWISPSDTVDSLLAAYLVAIERSNEIIKRCDNLNHPCARAAGKAGAVRPMRWVLVHMIEETARHAGHADILREQADGRCPAVTTIDMGLWPCSTARSSSVVNPPRERPSP